MQIKRLGGTVSLVPSTMATVAAAAAVGEWVDSEPSAQHALADLTLLRRCICLKSPRRLLASPLLSTQVNMYSY